MMKKPLFCAAAALITVLASCNPTIGEYNGVNVHNAQNPMLTPSLYSETGGVNPLLIQGKDQPGYVNPYPTGTYEHFVAQPEYPKTSFPGGPLLPLKHWVLCPILGALTPRLSGLSV